MAERDVVYCGKQKNLSVLELNLVTSCKQSLPKNYCTRLKLFLLIVKMRNTLAA